MNTYSSRHRIWRCSYCAKSRFTLQNSVLFIRLSQLHHIMLYTRLVDYFFKQVATCNHTNLVTDTDRGLKIICNGDDRGHHRSWLHLISNKTTQTDMLITRNEINVETEPNCLLWHGFFLVLGFLLSQWLRILTCWMQTSFTHLFKCHCVTNNVLSGF